MQSRGQLKERAFVKRLQEINADEAKHRIRMAQGLPLTTDKPEVIEGGRERVLIISMEWVKMVSEYQLPLRTGLK